MKTLRLTVDEGEDVRLATNIFCEEGVVDAGESSVLDDGYIAGVQYLLGKLLTNIQRNQQRRVDEQKLEAD